MHYLMTATSPLLIKITKNPIDNTEIKRPLTPNPSQEFDNGLGRGLPRGRQITISPEAWRRQENQSGLYARFGDFTVGWRTGNWERLMQRISVSFYSIGNGESWPSDETIPI